MHYVVRFALERGLYKDIVFFTLEEANEFYRNFDRIYKALLAVSMDGTETKVAEHNGWKHQVFDRTSPVADMKSVPCRRMRVSGDDAWVYLLDAVYQYKKSGSMWKPIAVYGIESEYEFSY